MKYSSKLFVAALGIMSILYACDKKDAIPTYSSGTAPVLSSSVATIAALPSDSDHVVVTFSWTSPKYATDSASVKYILEIDSTGRSFSKEATKIVVGPLSTTFTAKDLNNIMLGYGFNYNVPYDMDIRLTASYGNNNEQYKSNVLKVRMTPYVIPPKVVPPTSGHLFLVGDATQGGWNNPVPVPTQEFSKLDSVTYAGVFNMIGGNQYLMLPVNGDWTHKFAVANTSLTGLNAGGDFGFDFSSNFPAPATSGWYKIVVNFQQGKFTVTPYTTPLPTTFVITGDATPLGWANPVTAAQTFTRINSSVWEIASVPLVSTGQYLLLPLNGDWTHKYAVANNTLTGLGAGGEFGYDFSQNFPGPSVSGNYKISVNFAATTTQANAAGKFTATKL